MGTHSSSIMQATALPQGQMESEGARLNTTQQGEVDYGSEVQEGKEPYPNASVAFFTLFFRVSCIAAYLFCSWFTTNFVMVFVICVLLSAADFWTIKNVSGRLLVGLRWWNYVKEDGSTNWIFESLEDMDAINPNDSRIFWLGLYAPVFFWGALLV